MACTNVKNLFTKMRKALSAVILFSLIFSLICESAFARAGGRSSMGSSGRSSTSYSNQGSRGNRTFESGGAGGKNYAPMQKSAAQNSARGANGAAQQAAAANSQFRRPSGAANFFRRNPMLSTFGAIIAGSWLGHMIFGNTGFGPYGYGNDGFFINLVLMALGAFAVMFLVKRLTRREPSCADSFGTNYAQGGFNDSFYSHKPDFSRAPIVNISLPESEKNKFSQILIEVQKAWNNQDTESLKKIVTPEMARYFSDSLAQNFSQGIVNKVEDVEVTHVEISESWREGEVEYATAIIEWSSFDYMANLNKNPNDLNYIIEGGNKSLIMATEAWTFVRQDQNGVWSLSAIAQVE